MLREGVLGAVLVIMGDFSMFSCFWAKTANVDCILLAVVVVDCVVESNEVTYGVGKKKTAIFNKILLVELNFLFLLYSEDSEDCGVTGDLSC